LFKVDMPSVDMTDEELVRLVTVRFMPGRFKGRQALEADAVKGDVVALAKLEIELGLADKSALRHAYERRIDAEVRRNKAYAYNFGLPEDVWKKLALVPQGKRLPILLGLVARREDVSSAEDLIPPAEIKRIQKLQKQRFDEKEPYEYYHPRFQTKLEERLKERLDEAIAKTHWSRYRFWHNRVEVVPLGQERVEFENVPRWVRERVGSGWGNSYKSKEVFRMEERRRWYLSRAMLSPATIAMQLKNTRGVYLTPNMRVRRGRDNSTMITEVFHRTQSAFPWGQEVPRWIRRKS
jgi:hypothetical protein